VGTRPQAPRQVMRTYLSGFTAVCPALGRMTSLHIWEELREKNFATRAFRDLDEVEDHLCRGLNDLAKDPEKLRSMTNFPYLNITC
jgi:hypothetical protein